RALECPNFPGVFLRAEHGVLLLALQAEKGIHAGFRLACGAEFLTLFLNVALEAVERVLIPGGGYRSSWREQVSPLQIRGIEQRRYIWLPRLRLVLRWQISHV